MKKKFILSFVLLFLAAIPVLYSTLFLGASLDPYGNMNQLPVALVNGENNIAKETLLKKRLFDFKKEKNLALAKKELEDGKVYAIINFDKDFQNQLKNFPKAHEHTKIQLITSAGLNFFSSKVITTTLNQFVTGLNATLSTSFIKQMQGREIPDSIGSIITLDTEDLHPVKNNGEAMAPYLFSLTLFVGGIFVNQFVMRNFKKRGELFKTYWTKQFLIPVAIGLAQTLLLLVGNYLFIHVPVHALFQLMLFLFLSALTFYSIIVGFNKLIPGIGSLIVLLLTMFQTSSAAGVYPILLTNRLFKTINAFIPMTYTIKGLKSILSLNSSQLTENIIVLIGFLLFGQLLIVLAHFLHEQPIHKTTDLGKKKKTTQQQA